MGGVTPSAIAVASHQQGMITWTQLVGAGMSRDAITANAGAGLLRRRHRGVYQLGVFGGPFGVEMAALLACGPSALISHWSACAVFELCHRRRLVDVTSQWVTKRRGIRGHLAGSLDPADVVVRHGLRVTSPARTLLDVAPYSSVAELERLVEEVQVQNLASLAEILAVIERGARRPGASRGGGSSASVERLDRFSARRSCLPVSATDNRI
jgi:hypothetical protein